MEKDYYKILGVDRNVSEDELKRVFRKKAMEYHPDRQQGKSEDEKKKAEEMFKDINEAYSVLGDKDKRANYDRFGTADVNRGFGGGGFDPFEFFRRHMEGMGGFDSFSDFDGFTGFGFGGSGGGETVDPNAPKNGKDVRIRVGIPLEMSLYGSKKEFSIRVDDPCDHCNGTGSEDGKFQNCPHCGGSGMLTQRRGMMIMQSTCPHCRGSGQVIEKKCHKCGGYGHVSSIRNIKIDIPQGISSGETLVVNGEGIRGTNGGSSGRLLVTIMVENSGLFEREGLNLATELQLSPITATLGGNVDVMTPWGMAKLKIPSETANGKVFRLSGKGVKGKSGTGDLYVRVSVDSLKDITKEQRELLEKLNSTVTDGNIRNMGDMKRMYSEFEKAKREMRA